MNEKDALDEEVQFLALWAARFGAALQLEGECGFGRECVGITKGHGYIDWAGYTEDWSRDADWVVKEAAPPSEVVDAYHKHDCLAVLGRGPDAVHQLYVWVKNLDDHGIVIKTLPRQPESAIHALLHGFEQNVLTRAAGVETDREAQNDAD